MRQELIDTIGNGFTAFYRLLNQILDITPIKILISPISFIINFIQGVFNFLWFAIRSIYHLIIGIFDTVVNGTYSVSSYLSEVFDGLGVFLGVSTNVLQSLLQLVMILIIFGFVVRVFLGKFHYKNKSPK